MAIWHDTFPLDLVTQHSPDTLVSHLGIEFVEAGDDYVTANSRALAFFRPRALAGVGRRAKRTRR